jgi:hypothetical protein
MKMTRLRNHADFFTLPNAVWLPKRAFLSFELRIALNSVVEKG